MPSRNAPTGPLIRKELRELAVSPSFALMLVLTGFLVGHEFISSVATYSQLSGGGAALARGMNPLDGVLVPTFGAYDLVAMLLLPFVVIRVFSAERTTGAWTLLAQSPASVGQMVAAKGIALLVAWVVALVPGLIAVVLWMSYGGHVYAPELAVLLFGHLIRAALTIAIAALASAVTRQAATAAIITLGVTIGTWALDFAAATRGGAWTKIAAFTRHRRAADVRAGVAPHGHRLCLAGDRRRWPDDRGGVARAGHFAAAQVDRHDAGGPGLLGRHGGPDADEHERRRHRRSPPLVL